MQEIDLKYLREVVKVAWSARENGNHPFGAILVGPDQEILLRVENTVSTEKDVTGHAETNLVREASKIYSPEFLATCTMYASTEPCAMCAGAVFWSNIRRVVFALSEDRLYQLVGDKPDVAIFALPCREVFSHGRHEIEVVGPVDVPDAEDVHKGFW
jgi:tRNA(Arg) A34 adenosine deaminase TadA